ncbi:hypothetical protein AAG906_025792 [Vitis piasezkii]
MMVAFRDSWSIFGTTPVLRSGYGGFHHFGIAIDGKLLGLLGFSRFRTHGFYDPDLGGSTIFGIHTDGKLWDSWSLFDTMQILRSVLAASTIFGIHRDVLRSVLADTTIFGIPAMDTTIFGIHTDGKLLGTRRLLRDSSGRFWYSGFYDPVLADTTIFGIHEGKLFRTSWVGFDLLLTEFCDPSADSTILIIHTDGKLFRDSWSVFRYCQFYDPVTVDSTTLVLPLMVSFSGLLGRIFGASMDSTIDLGGFYYFRYSRMVAFGTHRSFSIFMDSTIRLGRLYHFRSTIRLMRDSTTFGIHRDGKLFRDSSGQFSVLMQFYTIRAADTTIFGIHTDGKLFRDSWVGFRFAQFYDPCGGHYHFGIHIDGKAFRDSWGRFRYYRFHDPMRPDTTIFGILAMVAFRDWVTFDSPYGFYGSVWPNSTIFGILRW